MSLEPVLEDMVDKLAETFEEVTGKKLGMMRRGKICAELFWASSQKSQIEAFLKSLTLFFIMSKEFRAFLEQFKSAWDKQMKLVLVGNDLKQGQQVSRYLWRKARQQMNEDRDNAIDQ